MSYIVLYNKLDNLIMSDIINNAKCINLFFQKNKISILMYY